MTPTTPFLYGTFGGTLPLAKHPVRANTTLKTWEGYTIVKWPMAWTS